jgi:hypothetical protein
LGKYDIVMQTIRKCVYEIKQIYEVSDLSEFKIFWAACRQVSRLIRQMWRIAREYSKIEYQENNNLLVSRRRGINGFLNSLPAG